MSLGFFLSGKAKSAEVYISGLRCLHLINGHENPTLRPGIVKLILNGQNRLEKDYIEANSNRIAVTIPILKLLKKNLAKCHLDKERKFLIWSVATLAFCGGFRIHKLLSRERLSFDPNCTLLGKDVFGRANFFLSNQSFQEIYKICCKDLIQCTKACF